MIIGEPPKGYTGAETLLGSIDSNVTTKSWYGLNGLVEHVYYLRGAIFASAVGGCQNYFVLNFNSDFGTNYVVDLFAIKNGAVVTGTWAGSQQAAFISQPMTANHEFNYVLDLTITTGYYSNVTYVTGNVYARDDNTGDQWIWQVMGYWSGASNLNSITIGNWGTSPSGWLNLVLTTPTIKP